MLWWIFVACRKHACWLQLLPTYWKLQQRTTDEVRTGQCLSGFGQWACRQRSNLLLQPCWQPIHRDTDPATKIIVSIKKHQNACGSLNFLCFPLTPTSLGIRASMRWSWDFLPPMTVCFPAIHWIVGSGFDEMLMERTACVPSSGTRIVTSSSDDLGASVNADRTNLLTLFNNTWQAELLQAVWNFLPTNSFHYRKSHFT